MSAAARPGCASADDDDRCGSPLRVSSAYFAGGFAGAFSRTNTCRRSRSTRQQAIGSSAGARSASPVSQAEARVMQRAANRVVRRPARRRARRGSACNAHRPRRSRSPLRASRTSSSPTRPSRRPPSGSELTETPAARSGGVGLCESSHRDLVMTQTPVSARAACS